MAKLSTQPSIKGNSCVFFFFLPLKRTPKIKLIQWRVCFEAQVSGSQVCAVLVLLRLLNGEAVERHKGSDTLRTKHMKGSLQWPRATKEFRHVSSACPGLNNSILYRPQKKLKTKTQVPTISFTPFYCSALFPFQAMKLGHRERERALQRGSQGCPHEDISFMK